MATMEINQDALIDKYLNGLMDELENKMANDPRYEDIDLDVIYTMTDSVQFMEDYPNMPWEQRFEMALRAIDNGTHKRYRPFRQIDLVNDYEFSRKQIEKDQEVERRVREMFGEPERVEQVERVERFSRCW